jgi:hypothetical protein
MNDPLTKSQTALRGRDLRDLSAEQLHDWIDACTKMERWVGANRARRTWTRSREEAAAELARRDVLVPGVEPGDT